MLGFHRQALGLRSLAVSGGASVYIGLRVNTKLSKTSSYVAGLKGFKGQGAVDIQMLKVLDRDCTAYPTILPSPQQTHKLEIV